MILVFGHLRGGMFPLYALLNIVEYNLFKLMNILPSLWAMFTSNQESQPNQPKQSDMQIECVI